MPTSADACLVGALVRLCLCMRKSEFFLCVCVRDVLGVWHSHSSHLPTIATSSLLLPPLTIQVSIVGIGHDFKTFDGEDVQQYIDLMDKDEIAEAPAEGMQE